MKTYTGILAFLLILQWGFVLSSAKYINTPCTAVSDCGVDNHLQCINGFCQCDSLHQIYDQTSNQCLLLVGRQCQIHVQDSQNSDSSSQFPMKCVPHALCTKSVCKCREGYKLSADFLCRPDYGTPCHAKDNCDNSLGLSCYQGICQCLNSSWTYQGHFGCIDPDNQHFNEMVNLLNQTQVLLKENNLEIRDMFNDLGLQNDPNSEFIFGNMLAEARQFQDTYNTHDLQFAAQNQNSQQSGGGGDGGGLNIGQLFSLFQSFSSLLGRNNQNQNQGSGGSGGGGGGNNGLFGGFFRNLFGGGQSGGGNQAAGYPESSSGYQPSGQPEMNQGQRFNLINSFLNLFNQMIPIVRQLRMRFSPVRFFQNLLNRFSPTTTTTAAPAPAASIHSGPPTVIQHNGNFQPNPIFDGNQNQQSADQGSNQGAGTFRFLTRTRNRFRQALRGNQGGYDPPANPPGKYGPPSGKYGPPPAEAPQPVAQKEEPAPGTGEASQQNYYANQAPSGFNGQHQPQPQVQQVQHIQHATTTNYNNLPRAPPSIGQAHQSAPAQRQQTFASLPSPSTFNSGNHPNPQSFFTQPQQSVHQNPQNANANHLQTQNQQFQQQNNINPNQQQQHHHLQQNFNAQGQATSHLHQTTFTQQSPQTSQHNHHQLNQIQHHQTNDANQNGFNNFNNRPGAHIAPNNVPTSPPAPQIPQFKLPVPQQSTLPSKENLSHNFILSEADDPHPGFTPLSSSPPPNQHQNHVSFRTAARFERIGQDEPNNNNNAEATATNAAAQNWRDSF